MTEALFGLVALTAMEIVLGIDNIVFITIVTSRLPEEQRPLAWRLGLGLAMILRIILLFMITWILGLTEPVFHLESLGIDKAWLIPQDVTDPELKHQWEHFWETVNPVSVRDLILFGGGLFLVGKTVHEIHHELEGPSDAERVGAGDGPEKARASLAGALLQICLLDIIFSLDSVITAVGMVAKDKRSVMVAAIVISVIVMVIFARRVGEFVQRNPTIKMLALSFLILIGVMLIAEGAGTHVEKGYIYFAMAFSLVVEFLNMRLRRAHGHT